ncbi:LPS assembly lipoprotein LptE [Pseudomonas sp. nanlin1]|uniref:LPS-assembly lipoprotein LptE n=1 Tax=Pseudomonas sp. nanlin1 TaxID=3040605 RepID=UPI003891118C
MIKRNLLVMGLAVLLSACGFQLRGTGTNQMSITELDVSARDAYGDTVKQLRKALTNSDVRVYQGAPYKLVLTREVSSQRTASSTGSSRIAEYELSTELTYEIRGDQDRVLLSDAFDIQRTYAHDGSNLTGSDTESKQVSAEMRRELVQRMMLRLEQITPAQLEELQAKADARAKAEADAAEAAQRAMEAQPQQSPIQLPSR